MFTPRAASRVQLPLPSPTEVQLPTAGGGGGASNGSAGAATISAGSAVRPTASTLRSLRRQQPQQHPTTPPAHKRAKLQRVLIENRFHRLETFATLPEKVSTALKTSDDALGRVTPDGWAIVITRSSLFVWDVRSAADCHVLSTATDSKRSGVGVSNVVSYGAANRVHLLFRPPKPSSLYQPVLMPATGAADASAAAAAANSGAPPAAELAAAMYVSESGVVFVWETPALPPPPHAASGGDTKSNSTALVLAGAIAPARTIQLPLTAQETITKVGRSHSASNQFVCGTNAGRALYMQLVTGSTANDVKEMTRPASSASGGSSGVSVTAVATNMWFGIGRMLGMAANTIKAAASPIRAIVSSARPGDTTAPFFVLSSGALSLWQVSATAQTFVWETALPELSKELTVKCAQTPRSVELIDAAITRKEVIVLARAQMPRGDELIIGVYRYGYGYGVSGGNAAGSNTGAPIFSHSVLLDLGRDTAVASTASASTRNVSLGVVDGDDLVVYVFGRKLVYMVQGDARGHETPSSLSMDGQNTIGGGVCSVSSVVQPSQSPNAATASAALSLSPALLVMTDTGGVIAVHFKPHTGSADAEADAQFFPLPDSIGGTGSAAAATSKSALDSKHTTAAAAQPRTNASAGGVAAAAASAVGKTSAAAAGANRASYLTDSKQTESNIELLRTALHLFAHNQSAEAIAALRTFELKVGGSASTLPTANASAASSQATSLDECVLAVSARVIDALPFTGKARLENAVASTGLALHDAESAVIGTHLKEKEIRYRQLMSLISYKSGSGGSGSIWQKLSYNTQHRLKEFGEMLQSALSLHALLNNFDGGDRDYISLRRQLVFAVMRDVIQRRNDHHLLPEGLSVADIFFTKVSAIADTLPSLDAQLGTYLRLLPSSTDEQSAKHARTIAVRIVNSIFDALLTNAIKYRSEYRDALPLGEPPAVNTASGGGSGGGDTSGPVRAWTFSDSMRALLRKHLQDIAGVLQLTAGIRALEKSRINLYQSIHRAGGFFLSDYLEYFSLVESIKNASAVMGDGWTRLRADFASDRSDIIALLKSLAPVPGQLEIVFKFAEEFEDFDALIDLCDHEQAEARTSAPLSAAAGLAAATSGIAPRGTARLIQYMREWGQVFANHLFRAYAHRKNRAHALLEISEPAEYADWLDAFLTEFPHLSWLHHIQTEQYRSAAATTRSQAGQQSSLANKKHYLSVSKLSLLAAGDAPESDSVQRLNDELDVVGAQSYADSGNLNAPVLPPATLIHQLLATKPSLLEPHEPYILAVEVYCKGVLPTLIEAKVNEHERALRQTNATRLLQLIWAKIIAADSDKWSTVQEMKSQASDESWEEPARSTHLYAAVSHLARYRFYEKERFFTDTFRAAAAAPETAPSEALKNVLRAVFESGSRPPPPSAAPSAAASTAATQASAKPPPPTSYGFGLSTPVRSFSVETQHDRTAYTYDDPSAAGDIKLPAFPPITPSAAAGFGADPFAVNTSPIPAESSPSVSLPTPAATSSRMNDAGADADPDEDL